MDNWANTTVNAIEADRGSGFVLTSDALLGNIVSLGNAKFDEARGSATFEELIDFRFRIGNLLTADADPASPPKLGGVESELSWKLEYIMQKPLRYMRATGPIDPTRRKVFDYYEPLASPPHAYRGLYSGMFAYRSKGPKQKLANVAVPRAAGILRELGNPRQYDWEIDMSFFRFDGDTLVGSVWGQLLANHRP